MSEKNLVFINLLGKAVGVEVLYSYNDRIKTKVYNAMGFIASFEYAKAHGTQLISGAKTREMMFPEAGNGYDSIDVIHYFYSKATSDYPINHRFHSVKKILTADYNMFLKYCEAYGCMFLISPSVDEVKEISELKVDKPKNRWFCYDWRG